MRKVVTVLALALAASNAAWAGVVWGKPCADTTPAPEEARAKPGAEPVRAAAATSPERHRELAARRKAWVADALQVGDSAKREAALREIETALSSTDAALATGALRTVIEVRSLEQESARFRPGVLARLDDADPNVRGVAAYALFNIPHEEGDLERVLAKLEAASPDSHALLHVALLLNKSRAEGRVADEFVRFLTGADDRQAEDIANLLRSQWVSPEVENAVLAAKERSKRTESGLWPYILGQMRPTREPRVRAILAWMATSATSSDVQLLERAVVREVDPPAKPLATALALEALPTGVDELTRRTLLQVVVANGTAENAPAVRAFAENPLVGDELRQVAKEAANTLERARR